MDPPIVDVPQFWPLILRVPTVILITERVHAFLGSALLFITASASKSCIEFVLVEGLLERLGFHDVGVHFGAMCKWSNTLIHAVLIDVDEQIHPHLFGHPVTKFDHFFELPGRINVEQGKWRSGGGKCFLGQVQHDCRIFADGIQHHRILKLGNHLTNDVDAL